MTEITKLHNDSMDLAEKAFLARMKGAYNEADELFRASLRLELQAVELIDNSPCEPSYSILHRSAATLALDCNEPRLAEKLIGKALAQEPPPEVAEELRDLLEQVYFRRHLQLRGITLGDDELQISLAGRAVGSGIVQSEQLLQRVDNASKLIYRTVERRQSRPFRESGPPKRAISENYAVFLSLARPGSYAITLKLGRPSEQQRLPDIVDTPEIVGEFMDLMSLLNKGEFGQLETRIPERAYRTNFVQLARQIAPDGERVSMVGFTSMERGQKRYVEVTRPQADIVPPWESGDGTLEHLERVTIRGILRFADATRPERRQIKIVDEETQKARLVKVPEGMMNDIVKPLWDCSVVVTGTRRGKDVVLETIKEQ